MRTKFIILNDVLVRVDLIDKVKMEHFNNEDEKITKLRFHLSTGALITLELCGYPQFESLEETLKYYSKQKIIKKFNF